MMVGCHVIENQEIGFKKFGTELRRVVGLLGNVITCLQPLLNCQFHFNPAVSKPHLEAASAILSAVGETLYTDNERVLDMATALSGSGPAYVFLIAEALTDAGVYIGLPRQWASRLALQAIAEGPSHDTPSAPDPATAAGLNILEQAGVRTAMANAVGAAYRKAVRMN